VFQSLFSRFLSGASPDVAGRIDRAAVEELTGHRIRNIKLFERALTHRSILRFEPDAFLHSNERLEFLGDAILGLFVAEHLFFQFPDRDEGFLTRLRAKLVNGKALARSAEKISLGDHIMTGPGTADEHGKVSDSILADAFEAVIGAIYLDLGTDAARSFVDRTVLEGIDLDQLAARRDNYKSLLLEFAQAHRWSQPTYRVSSENGPSHQKIFTVEVLLDGESLGQGSASSKKTAEQLAARHALAVLRNQEQDS
jgi:ribonuclease III